MGGHSWGCLSRRSTRTRRSSTNRTGGKLSERMVKESRMECVYLLFLIFLSRLSHTVRAAEKTLDMAPNAVDDVFSECRDQMLKAVTEQGGLLQKELQNQEEFKDMWNTTGSCNKEITGLTVFHSTALQSYGNSKTRTRKTFNEKVHASGGNATTYKDEFPFKSLHFLLTDTMQHLNNNKTCQQVYYGTKNIYTAKTGTEIRFGKFIQPGSDKSLQEEKADEGTLFNIISCSVVNVENLACSPEEIELLISPTEVFTVEDVQDVSGSDADYRMITLKHSRYLRTHDCYLFDTISEATTPSSRDLTQAPGGSSSPLPSSTILALLAFFMSLYYCTAPQ